MNRDEFGSVRERRFDLYVVDHLGNTFHAIGPRYDMRACFHQIGHRPAVPSAFNHVIGNESDGFRVVKLDPARLAFARDHGRQRDQKLVTQTSSQNHEEQVMEINGGAKSRSQTPALEAEFTVNAREPQTPQNDPKVPSTPQVRDLIPTPPQTQERLGELPNNDAFQSKGTPNRMEGSPVEDHDLKPSGKFSSIRHFQILFLNFSNHDSKPSFWGNHTHPHLEKVALLLLVSCFKWKISKIPFEII